MLTQKSIKLSDYISYPFEIPSINLDFNISRDDVVVEALMIINPMDYESDRKSHKQSLIDSNCDNRCLSEDLKKFIIYCKL